MPTCPPLLSVAAPLPRTDSAFARTRNSTTSHLPLPTYRPSPCTYLGRDMFSSTVRRAASSAPQTSIASSLSSTTPRATVAQALSYRCHQRRFSSSKPSSPADGSKGIAEGQTVPAAPAKARPDGEQKSSRASRKKAKDVAANSTVKGRDESMLHLPSVPSTQHIAPMRKFSNLWLLVILCSNKILLQKSLPLLSSHSTDRFRPHIASLKPSLTMPLLQSSHREREQTRNPRK